LRFLFQGDSCFPLSPLDKSKQKTNKEGKKQHCISKLDQVKVILRDIGRQSESQLSFISSKHAISYVKDLEAKSQENKVNDEPALITHAKAIN
jgi:hypothetical protein